MTMTIETIIPISLLIIVIIGYLVNKQRELQKTIDTFQTDKENQKEQFNIMLNKQQEQNKELSKLLKEQQQQNNRLEQSKEKEKNEFIEQNKELNKLLKEQQQQKNGLDQSIKELNIQLGNKNNMLNEFKTVNMNMDNKLNPITSFLSSFTSNNQKGGKISEMFLEQMLESYGFRYIDNDITPEVSTFQTQTSFEGGSKKPDVILNISEENFVVIDSKSVTTDLTEGFSEHEIKRNISSQMELLVKKEYMYLIDEDNNRKSVDFVLMFVPFEVMDIIELNQFSKGVILCTPSTLQPILYMIKSFMKTQQYGSLKGLEKDLKVFFEYVVESLNLLSSARTTIKKLDKDLDKLYEKQESIDTHELFNSFKELANIETKKKLNKTI